LPALAIHWGPWGEIGAATKGAVLERARATGIAAIDPGAGMELLALLMRSTSSEVAALDMDWDLFRSRQAGASGRGIFGGAGLTERDRLAGATTPAMGEARGSLLRAVHAAAPAHRLEVLVAGVQAAASEALGVARSGEVDPTTPLAELGLDSLMSLELRNALAMKLDRTLPATLLFNFPSVKELADHLAGELGLHTASADKPAACETTGLDALSEDDMAELLARKLAGMDGVES
jgi:acyl carrier protein